MKGRRKKTDNAKVHAIAFGRVTRIEYVNDRGQRFFHVFGGRGTQAARTKDGRYLIIGGGRTRFSDEIEG